MSESGRQFSSKKIRASDFSDAQFPEVPSRTKSSLLQRGDRRSTGPGWCGLYKAHRRVLKGAEAAHTGNVNRELIRLHVVLGGRTCSCVTVPALTGIRRVPV